MLHHLLCQLLKMIFVLHMYAQANLDELVLTFTYLAMQMIKKMR